MIFANEKLRSAPKTQVTHPEWKCARDNQSPKKIRRGYFGVLSENSEPVVSTEDLALILNALQRYQSL